MLLWEGLPRNVLPGLRIMALRQNLSNCQLRAGVGVRYKLSDRFALFAEPLVSHHFDTESETKTFENRTCHEFEPLVWSTYDLLTLKTVQ